MGVVVFWWSSSNLGRCALQLTLAACAFFSGGADADPNTVAPPLFNGFPAPDPVVAAADTPMKSPTDRAISILLGATMAPALTVELCAKLLPESTDNNKRAFAEWREQHKPSLALIDRNAQALILRNSHGDNSLAAKVRQLYHDRSYADFREQYRRDPEGIEATCKSYWRVLPMFDIESKYARELATVRAHPIAAGPAAPNDK